MGTKVSFGVVWQMYGRQTIELPDTVNADDKQAVREYIESIWDDLPLPSGEYLMESDELDPDSIVIEEPDPDPIKIGKPDPGQIRQLKKDDILEITLLSAEEMDAAKENIPIFEGWWWLRTPGARSDYVRCVNPEGDIDNDGRFVCGDMVGVRPALRIRPASADLPIGSKFLFGELSWTVIAPGLALCDGYLCTMYFRKFYQEADANMYETSDIRKYLNEWFAGVEDTGNMGVCG